MWHVRHIFTFLICIHVNGTFEKCLVCLKSGVHCTKHTKKYRKMTPKAKFLFWFWGNDPTGSISAMIGFLYIWIQVSIMALLIIPQTEINQGLNKLSVINCQFIAVIFMNFWSSNFEQFEIFVWRFRHTIIWFPNVFHW